MWTKLHDRLHTTLKNYQLLPLQSRVLIAVSGGQDSICLLRLLLDLQSKWKWELAIIHCDHQWSMDEGLVDFIQSLSHNWKVKLYVRSTLENNLILPENEAKARWWRYQVMTKTAYLEQYSHLVTAHTQSDRAETLLFNLARGAGVKGLCTLNWVRPLDHGILLTRPLLNVSRAETGQFCEDLKLPLWLDPANEQSRFTRNRIRQQIIPYLQAQLNPHLEKHFAQTADILWAENECLETISEDYFQRGFDREKRRFDRTILQPLPLALQRRVLALFFKTLFLKIPTFLQVEEMVKLLGMGNRSNTSTLSEDYIITVQGKWFIAQKNKKFTPL